MFLIKADLHHDMIFLMEIDLALRAILSALLARIWDQIPAGHWKVKDSRALFSFFLAAAPDTPTRSNGEQLFYTGYIQPFFSEKLPEALEPSKIVIGIKSLAPSSGRPDESFLFIDSQGSGMNVQKFRYNTDWIQCFFLLGLHRSPL